MTEVLDGSSFFVQVIGEEQKRLQDIMAQIAERDYSSQPAFKPQRGDAVLALFSGDNQWYRAKVTHISEDGNVEVVYADYGNAEVVDASHIRKLDPEFGLNVLRWQAREAHLAYITTRPIEDDWGKEAALFLKELVWGKTLLATIEYRDGDNEYLSVWVEGTFEFVNAELVRPGLAKLNRRLPRGANREIIDFLRVAQEEAHNSHSGIWEYGDDGEDDDNFH